MAEDLKAFTDRLPAFAAGVGALIAGVAMLMDDFKDIGKTGAERNPPVPHHWMYGIIAIVGGVAGVGLTVLDLHKELVRRFGPRAVPKPRPKLEEAGPRLLQGVGSEVLEALR